MIGNLNHGRLLLLFDWLPIVAVRPGTFTLYLSVFLFCCLFYLFIFFLARFSVYSFHSIPEGDFEYKETRVCVYASERSMHAGFVHTVVCVC